jgi:origin recognition complex subunit 1
LATINGKATVTSLDTFLKKYPSGKIPRNSSQFGKTFICRRGCNTRTATYTDEFIWDEVFKGTEADIVNLIEFVKHGTKASRKRKAERKAPVDREDDYAEDDDKDSVTTPRKKRKVSGVSTPQKPKAPSKLLTPAHKRIVVKKPLEFTPLGTRVLSPGHTFASPFQIARSKLHVAAVPATLPCRENEFGEVYSHLESAIIDGSGACIYISGTPGTGKTATVREVVSQLNAAVESEELDDFIFVEINGMKVTDPHQSYSLLWEALKGDRVSPSQALDLLEREFNHPSPRRIPCVVLMDELDQLVTKNQSVMYNFFNWPNLRHSRLIVLAVANTMDLPERTLSNKISSRLGLTRITFPGYNHEQLMKIIQSRLEGVPGGIVEPDAVQFASRKVAAVSGDARRALDICRRAVELAESESNNAETAPNTPSKKAAAAQDSKKAGKVGKVTIATIKKAIHEATTSPLQQHLRGLSLASKLLLAALVAKIRRTGLGESVIGEIIEEAKRISKMAVEAQALHFLLMEISPDTVLSSRADEVTIRGPRVYAMGLAAIELLEAGIIGFEARKGDRVGKIRLCIGEGDLTQAFKDDPETKGLGF